VTLWLLAQHCLLLAEREWQITACLQNATCKELELSKQKSELLENWILEVVDIEQEHRLSDETNQ